MKNWEYENIRIEGRVGTWYEIDRRYVNNQLYVLFEHEEFGDETAGVVCIIPPIQKLIQVGKGHYNVIPREYEVGETWDDIDTALQDLGVEDTAMPYEELQEIKEQIGIQLNLLDEFSQKFRK